MRADIFADGVSTRLEGPLLFLRRTVNVGLNEAVEVIGASSGSVALRPSMMRC
jgi:V/A-type H+-transporting ATPase subunit B